MPSITQGKTNWKFLLIVIILAIIVGGVALWYAKRQEKPYQPVEIEKQKKVASEFIQINQPKINQTIFGFFQIEGTVNFPQEIMDNTVFIEMKDDNGHSLIPSFGTEEPTTFTITKNETPFSITVSYRYPSSTKGTIIVFVYVPTEGFVPTEGTLASWSRKDLAEIPIVFGEEIFNPPSDWKTYNNPEANFTFRYPSDWEIDTDYLYETAGGVKADERTVVVVKGEKYGITINMRQYPCPTQEVSKGGHTNYIGTCSQDPQNLDFFGKILSTFRVIDKTANWKTYKSERYGFEIRYPEDWIISKNILGAFDIYKNFDKYQCSVEIYANKDKYLYPLEESNNYFQGFSESQISIKPEETIVGNISATKISSPNLAGREIYFFKKKIEDKEYYLNIFLDVTDLRYKYDVIIKNHDCKEIFNQIIATFNFPENLSAKDLFDEPICKYRRAQFEMRIYDNQGRITGVLDGKIKEEIPGSYCTQDKESNQTIIDFFSKVMISKLEILGITEGNYDFSISGPSPEEPYDYIEVEADDIPITPGALHHFEFDWKGLSEGEKAIAILFDINNDGIFEKTIVFDNKLSCEEFILQLKER